MKYTKTLAVVNEGDPWVSYNVEQKGESYKLKDGTYSPKSRYGNSSTLTVTRTKKKNAKKFQNTDPTCDFTKRDLVEKKDANSGLSNSKIPLVLNKTGKNGNSATCNKISTGRTLLRFYWWIAITLDFYHIINAFLAT